MSQVYFYPILARVLGAEDDGGHPATRTTALSSAGLVCGMSFSATPAMPSSAACSLTPHWNEALPTRFNMPLLARPADNAEIERAGENLREDGQQVETHTAYNSSKPSGGSMTIRLRATSTS